MRSHSVVGLGHVVGGQQHRLARPDQGPDRGAQFPRGDRVHPDRRLVEEQHRRVVQQAAGDVQALPEAARVALDPVAGPIGEPDEVEHVTDPPALVAGRHPVQLGEVAQVVPRADPLVEALVAAEDVPDVARTQAASVATSCPRTRAVPDVGMRSVVSILMVVVFPAPFGPSRP
jgi:hypothetical protein